jgi:hypothetical protein
LGEGGKAIVQDHVLESLSAPRTINIATTPIILDHVLKSRAVVPAALLLEWMVDAARVHCPDQALSQIRDFIVWKGITLERHSEIEVNVNVKSVDRHSVECVLRSLGTKGEPVLHARALLSFSALEQGSVKRTNRTQDLQYRDLRPYQNLLFHGPSLQYIDAIHSNSADQIVAELNLHGHSAAWNLERDSFDAQAPLLDAIFQTAIVWLGLNQGSRGLPSRFTSIQYLRPWQMGKAILEMNIVSVSDQYVKVDALVWNATGELVARMQGFEATIAASLNEAFTQRLLPNSISIEKP